MMVRRTSSPCPSIMSSTTEPPSTCSDGRKTPWPLHEPGSAGVPAGLLNTAQPHYSNPRVACGMTLKPAGTPALPGPSLLKAEPLPPCLPCPAENAHGLYDSATTPAFHFPAARPALHPRHRCGL